MKYVYILCICLCLIYKISYADIPINYLVDCDLILKNGNIISGYYEYSNYGGCKYNEEKRSYLVIDDNLKWASYTQDLLLNQIKNIYVFSGSPIKIYKKIYKLHYIPKNKEKINTDANLVRVATYGALSKSYEEVYPSDIKRVKFKGCSELGVADLLLLDNFELKHLQHSAEAMFSIETALDVNLISYNKEYNTPEKIITFMNEYLKKNSLPPYNFNFQNKLTDQEWINFEKWINMIYDNRVNFKQECRNNNIILLLYHVVD